MACKQDAQDKILENKKTTGVCTAVSSPKVCSRCRLRAVPDETGICPQCEDYERYIEDLGENKTEPRKPKCARCKWRKVPDYAQLCNKCQKKSPERCRVNEVVKVLDEILLADMSLKESARFSLAKAYLSRLLGYPEFDDLHPSYLPNIWGGSHRSRENMEGKTIQEYVEIIPEGSDPMVMFEILFEKDHPVRRFDYFTDSPEKMYTKRNS